MHMLGYGHLNLNEWLFLNVSVFYHPDVSLSVVLSWHFPVAEALDSCIELEGEVSSDSSAGEGGYSHRRSECHRYCLNLDAEELEQVSLFLAELSRGNFALLM